LFYLSFTYFVSVLNVLNVICLPTSHTKEKNDVEAYCYPAIAKENLPAKHLFEKIAENSRKQDKKSSAKETKERQLYIKKNEDSAFTQALKKQLVLERSAPDFASAFAS
jgi:hypothetical protein